MGKHWACNVHVLELRLLRGRRKAKAPPASEPGCSTWPCTCTGGCAWLYWAGLCWCLAGITACCGKGTEKSPPPSPFYFIIFTRNIAGTEKLLVKGHTSAPPPTPSPSYSVPMSAYPCPQIAGMGMTLLRMTSGDARESRYLRIFK